MPTRRVASRTRLRLVWMVLLTLAILALPTTVYAWGRTAPSFNIETIAVTGAALIPERRLERLLKDDYLNHNLFTVTTEDVAASLRELPYVAGASVDRDFPSTLRVQIEEHRPAAYALADNGWFVISDEGYVIAAARLGVGESAPVRQAGGDGEEGDVPAAAPSPTAASPAPSISASPRPSASPTPRSTPTPAVAQPDEPDTASAAGPSAALRAGSKGAELRLPNLAVRGLLRPGDRLRDDDGVFAMAVIASLPASLLKRLSVVTVESGRATLLCRDNLTVVWGDDQRRAAKSIALRTVLAHYEKKRLKCTFVDVSVPDRSLARPLID